MSFPEATDAVVTAGLSVLTEVQLAEAIGEAFRKADPEVGLLLAVAAFARHRGVPLIYPRILKAVCSVEAVLREG